MFNEQGPLPERGGFWRRLGALVVDAFIIAAGLQFLGIPAYSLSGGRVQSNILTFEVCHGFDGVPPGFRIPPEFLPGYFYQCVNSWFGFPTGRSITISQHPPQAGTNTEATFQVDAEGHPLGAFSLDFRWLLVPVLLVYRIGFERRNGQTIGKRLTRVRVIEIDPGTGRFSPAAKRNLALFLPIIFAGFLPIEMPLWLVLIGVGIFCGIFCTVLIWQITTRRDTYYDKAAGTAVIRVEAHLPPVIVHASAA